MNHQFFNITSVSNEICKRLLQDGRTVLFAAVVEGNADVIQLLLDNGALIDKAGEVRCSNCSVNVFRSLYSEAIGFVVNCVLKALCIACFTEEYHVTVCCLQQQCS